MTELIPTMLRFLDKLPKTARSKSFQSRISGLIDVESLSSHSILGILLAKSIIHDGIRACGKGDCFFSEQPMQHYAMSLESGVQQHMADIARNILDSSAKLRQAVS